LSLVVRQLTINDLAVADEIVRAAYSMPPGQKTGLKRCLSLQPDGWLLVKSRDVAVALGGAMYYDSFGYVGLMSVLPSMQRHGIGRILMEHLLAWFYARNCSTILLDASPAGAPLYLSLGFIVDDTVIELCHHNNREFAISHQLSSHYRGNVSAMKEKDIPGLVAFDAQFFGAPRPTIFASYLGDCQHRAFVARDEMGNITGYLFAQTGGRLGPWVAAAPEDAERLLMHVLQQPAISDEFTVQVPSANREAQQLFLNYDFHPRRSLQHMRLGDPVQPRDRTKLYGQASFGLG
jgi:GNAT superfamily N-acetyltransferase